MWDRGGEAELASVLVARVAGYAWLKRWGFWQTVDYLGEIENQRGTRAALLELLLAQATSNRIQENEAEALEKQRRRRR